MKESAITKLMQENNKMGLLMQNLCGRLIGRGVYRDVYVFKPDQKYVVKIERDMNTGTFANATEWRNWINNKNWIVFSKWLAPCVTINEFGNVMIQRRALDSYKEYPKKIPSLFTDLKYQNFGWIGNQFVCFDYPFLRTENFRMMKANWWEPHRPGNT